MNPYCVIGNEALVLRKNVLDLLWKPLIYGMAKFMHHCPAHYRDTFSSHSIPMLCYRHFMFSNLSSNKSFQFSFYCCILNPVFFGDCKKTSCKETSVNYPPISNILLLVSLLNLLHEFFDDYKTSQMYFVLP